MRQGLLGLIILLSFVSGAHAGDAKLCDAPHKSGWSFGEGNRNPQYRIMVESSCKELTDSELTLLNPAAVAAVAEWNRTLNEAKADMRIYRYVLAFVNDHPLPAMIAVKGGAFELSGFGKLLTVGMSPIIPACSKIVFTLYSPWEPAEIGIQFSIVYEKNWFVINLNKAVLVPGYEHSHLGDSFTIDISKGTLLSLGCK